MAKKENQLMFKVIDGEAKIVPQKNSKKQEEQSFINKKNEKSTLGVDKNSGKAKRKGKVASWFRLDNAATIYPSSKNEHWTFVYRVSAVLKEKVKPDVLQKSLDEIMPRFPTFDVYLKRGFFWHYFEHSDRPLEIQREEDFPCSYMDLTDPNKHIIRVLFSDYRISLEVFHSISDGRGSLMFLNSLVGRYLENLGVSVSASEGCLNALDLPTMEEMEDSFFANATDEKGNSHKEVAAYNIKGTIEDEGIVNTTNGVMSVSEVKAIAKKYDCNLTVFIAACLCLATVRKRKNSKKPVKISIPIDLRRWFGSKTLRNFSSYVNIAVDNNEATLEEVIEIIKAEFAKIDKEYLQKNINSNVGAQKNWFIKLMPLCIKNFFLNLSFNVLGEKLQSFAFSNIGKVEAPKEFSEYIERYEVNLGRSKHNSIAVGLISFEDTMVFTISSKLAENTTERDVFRLLSELGIKVKVESNRRDEYGG